MPASVNLMVPPRKDAKRQKGGEVKSILGRERKTSAPEVFVEVPGKREAPAKENKKFRSIRKKDIKISARRKKSGSGVGENHEAPTPSGREKKAKKVLISPANTDECSVDKKKDDRSKDSKSMAKTPSASSSKKFNLELAQKFFKQMMESQKVRARTKEDLNLETMPESSQMGMSSKKVKKSTKRKKTEQLDRNYFKENGEPVWVMVERKPDEIELNEDGERVRYPELMAALEEDELEMEDGKGWTKRMVSYFMGELSKGKVEKKPSPKDMDVFASFEVLDKKEELYFQKDHIIYNTTDSIFNLSSNALERYIQGEEGTTTTRRNNPNNPPSCENTKTTISKEEEEKTCLVTSIKFDLANTFCISYDRRHPITSIRKLRKKYREQLKLSSELQEGKKEEVKKDEE